MSLTIPVSCVSDAFSFYRIVFFLIFLYLLSSYKSDSLHDEYDDDGSDSVSPGTYSFEKNLCVLTNSVGSVSGLGAGIFVPTGVESKCDIFCFLHSYQQESSPKVVNSSKKIGAQIPYFLSKF